MERNKYIKENNECRTEYLKKKKMNANIQWWELWKKMGMMEKYGSIPSEIRVWVLV